MELVQEIEAELSENPALEMVEVVTCPFCHRPMEGSRCPDCGQKPSAEEDSLDLFIRQRSQDYETDKNEYEDAEGEWEDDPARNQFSQHVGSFHDYLMSGFLSSQYPAGLRELGEYLVYSVNEDGFLKFDSEEVRVKFEASEEEVKLIVEVIQALEPIGVGAENPREALMIQLKALAEEGKGNALAEKLIAEHFEDLGKGRHEKIAEELGIPIVRVSETQEYIKRNLNPYPARAYSGRTPELVAMPRPAIAVKYDGQRLTYEVLELSDFQLRISKSYMDMYERYQAGGGGVSRDEVSHIRDYFRRAKFFLDSIGQRKETLDKIAKALCEEQSDFLIHGLPHFNAGLTQGRLAEKTGLHESTVSRAMSGKFVLVPGGEILSFDFFFDSSVRPKEYIKNMLANEDGKNPISDGDLAKLLSAKGIDIARRTVAKYREDMGIPSSYERKRSKKTNGD